MKLRLLPMFFCLITILTGCQEKIEEIDLSGTWNYKLDPDDIGEVENWASDVFEASIELPGTLDDAGIGKPLDHEPKMDNATLTSLHRKFSYVGAAWYQKEIEIPENWAGEFIELELERVIWESTVWVDGKKVEFRESLVAPHRYDLSKYLTPGKHTI